MNGITMGSKLGWLGRRRKPNGVNTKNTETQRLPAASCPTERFLCVTLGWDAKRAGFASVSFGRELNLLGFLGQPNLHELEKDEFLRQGRLYGNVPELRSRRLVSGCMEERQWSMQLIVLKRLLFKWISDSSYTHHRKESCGICGKLPCLNAEDF